MLHADAKSLVERGDRLFTKKQPWDTRNQDIAEQFYVERADFTTRRDIGDSYADHLVTGYPAMVRRDLGNSFGSMLRPKGQDWFHVRARRDEANEDHDAKAWLEWASGVQRRAMYERRSQFTRATKEADHDFAAFGGAVISTEANRRDTTLLYRCWHLRDVAWAEDSYGQIAEVHRNWQPTASELVAAFPKTVHPKTAEIASRDPHSEVRVRHCVIRADADNGKKFRQPWVSLYIDCDNQHVLEERGSWTQIYTIPRWATISGSQYPYSPATVIGLPDARLLQAMTLTLLDAGERAANPPMVGVAEAIRGDMNLFAGGFTAVDAEYDERLGEVLRPLSSDSRALPFGIDMADRTTAMLKEAFYLNKLSMPEHGGPEMTAFEVGQRVQEYIRQALPLFEPMEQDYNGQLCDISFETLMREGTFGSPDSIPDSLRGMDVDFAFESPLAELVERQKGQKFLEAKAILADMTAVDPTAPGIMDFGTTLRDVLSGIGVPAKWMRSPEDVSAMQRAEAEKVEATQLLAGMQQGADVAATLAQTAQVMQPQAY